MSADQTREQLMNAILQRSVSDPSFRRALLVEPKHAIRGAFGVEIPADFRIKFIEKGEEIDALVVLPDPRADDELTDDELETVAGGVETGYRWADEPSGTRTGRDQSFGMEAS